MKVSRTITNTHIHIQVHTHCFGDRQIQKLQKVKQKLTVLRKDLPLHCKIICFACILFLKLDNEALSQNRRDKYDRLTVVKGWGENKYLSLKISKLSFASILLTLAEYFIQFYYRKTSMVYKNSWIWEFVIFLSLICFMEKMISFPQRKIIKEVLHINFSQCKDASIFTEWLDEQLNPLLPKPKHHHRQIYIYSKKIL